MPTKQDLNNARKNRLELIAAGLTDRRQLLKLGLIGAGGYLVAKRGLSSRAWAEDRGGGGTTSPPTRAFVEPLPILVVKQPVALLNPAPTAAPNTSAGEGRTITHQAFSRFPAQKFYQVTQSQIQTRMSPDLPVQTIWGFDGMSPGPVYHAKYGEPILVRRHNNLPPLGKRNACRTTAL